MEQETEIISHICDMSGSRSPHEVFTDWVEMFAISIQNSCQFWHDDIWRKRERRYLNIVSRYKGKEIVRFIKMNGLLFDALEKEPTDILGQIYMKTELGSKRTGQFFTPFHISCLCAKLIATGELPIKLHEPSCGSGGMIIAVAKELQEKGINYQKELDVVAQDLDRRSAYMCYIQLSLLGIKGTVFQGDSLQTSNYLMKDYEYILRTPGNMGLII